MSNDKKNLEPKSMNDESLVRFDVSNEKFLKILDSGDMQQIAPLIAKKLQYTQELILCQKANKKALSKYVSCFKLNVEGQMALIDRDFRDILKLHFLKHGVNREAIAYYHDLKVFKEYLGVK